MLSFLAYDGTTISTNTQAVAENTLGDQADTKRRVRLLKVYSGDGSGPGRVALAIATFQRLHLGDGSVGLITRIELAPPSRHLTARPPAEGRVAGGVRRGYRKSTLVEALDAGGVGAGARVAAGAAAAPAAAAGAVHGPFRFPCVAAVPAPGRASGVGSGWGARPVAGAEAAVAFGPPGPVSQELLQEQLSQPQRSRKRAGRSQPGAALEASAAKAGAQRHMRVPSAVHPPALPSPVGGGGAGSPLLYDGPLTLDSEDWFLEEDAAGFGGSPVPMEEVFKDG